MGLANAAEDIGKLVGTTIDVIVIGSGYGAGVCAARLAQAGAQVVVLERGREFSAHGRRFPSDAAGCKENVHISGGPFGDSHRLGLYDFHISRDLDVLVGCGLGGTSLINASVAIEPDPAVFQLPVWPKAIRDDAANGTLEGYYSLARSVLDPSPWTPGHPGAPTPLKLQAMEANGAFRPHINVHFDETKAQNSLGVRQSYCRNCGDCSTGCNFEAKKTLCFTYLPIAKSYGAKIFVQCDVREVLPNPDVPGEWLVRYQYLVDGNEPIDTNVITLRAKRVVLGAGVLGSTGLLLRSKTAGLPVSDEVGGRVSGNGDAVALAYNCTDRLDSVGYGANVDPAHPVGPSITAVIDYRKGVPLENGIIIEEGAFPSAMASSMRWLVEIIATGGEETRHGFTHWFHERIAEGRDLFGSPNEGALNKTLIFLLMGHDGADGEIELDEHARPVVRWPQLHERPVFAAENQLALAVAANLGGRFVPDPLNTKWFLNNNITVHPLGGCPMGDVASEAVVDDVGRVFDDSKTGTKLAGLFVADGSVIPTSLGVNPLLTITALAERTAKHLVTELGLPYNPVPRLGPAPVDP